MGGLIIGDAAVSANLVSPMSVVVVAMSALSSFAIPNEEFSAPFRLLKFGFILLGEIWVFSVLFWGCTGCLAIWPAFPVFGSLI